VKRIVWPILFTVVVSLAALSSESTVPRFVDVTEQVGIRFQHISGPPADREFDYIFETKGGGIAFLDYDVDGWLDLLVVQGSTVEAARRGVRRPPGLFRNRGDGTFEDVSESSGIEGGIWGMGVGVGDYDNDGYPDVYLTQVGPDLLYRNNGDGTFTDVTRQAGITADTWTTSAAFGDYDGDGFPDLYVAGYLDYTPDRLPPKTPDCTYLGRPVPCGPRGLKGARDYLFHNRGDGTFEEVSRISGAWDRSHYYGLGVLWADFDNDGDLDLFVGNDATPNYLFVNHGGRFSEEALVAGVALSGEGVEQASMGVDAGDYDNDGRLDLFCTHFARDSSTLYHNDGDLLFSDVTAPAGLRVPEWWLVGWGTRFLDLDCDGWLDILHVNGHVYRYLAEPVEGETLAQPASLYRNRGDGTFEDVAALAGPDFVSPRIARGAAFGDYDNDGDLDVAVAVLGGSPRLLRMDRRDSNHWVLLQLVGGQENRDALGARVQVVCGGRTSIREVRRTVGIYSSSDPRIHVGLGSCERIEELMIRWPDGSRQKIENLPADGIYRIRKGEDPVVIGP